VDAKPTKVLQAHGGALNSGGTPGNRGGGGRPPSEARRMAREMFTDRLPVLDAIAEGRVVVPLVEQCAKCGYEPTDEDEQQRAKAIERSPRPSEQVRAMSPLEVQDKTRTRVSARDERIREVDGLKELQRSGLDGQRA
jgi:hypothetical protein